MRFMNAGKRVAGAVFADAGRSHREARVGGDCLEPRIHRDRADLILGCDGRHDDGVGNGNAGLLQPRAVVSFAANPRLIVGRDPVECFERRHVTDHHNSRSL
jgi:hypothetical protein